MKRLTQLFSSASFYDALQWLLAPIGSLRIMRLLADIAKVSDGRVLDVGCGTGKYAAIFKNKEYFGSDVDDVYLNKARRRYPFGKFCKATAANLPFEDGFFDTIFCVSTFHHLNDIEVSASIKEMLRTCRVGGRVVIIDNIYPAGWNLLGNILFFLDRGRYQRSFADLQALLESTGLVCERRFSGFPYEYAVFIKNI